MPMYRIRPGYSFRDSDGSVRTGGEFIDLGIDVAAQHAEKVDLVDQPEPVNEVEAPE